MLRRRKEKGINGQWPMGKGGREWQWRNLSSFSDKTKQGICWTMRGIVKKLARLSMVNEPKPVQTVTRCKYTWLRKRKRMLIGISLRVLRVKSHALDGSPSCERVRDKGRAGEGKTFETLSSVDNVILTKV